MEQEKKEKNAEDPSKDRVSPPGRIYRWAENGTGDSRSEGTKQFLFPWVSG